MKPFCIAHRGKHKNYFENTVEAFEEAGKGEYFGIETDIHLSKDKKWIIHHDAEFYTNGKMVVIKNELADSLTKMPLDNSYGIKNAFCPYFEEYLDICKKYNKRPIIEIKPSKVSYKNLKNMVKIIKARFDIKDVTIIAFYPWPLLKLRVILGRKIHLQHLVSSKHASFVTKIALRHKMDLDIDQEILTENIVEKFHSRKLKVNVWTVDKKEDLQKIINMGVDYITTNEFNQNS